MQTENVERLDELTQGSRKQLKEQAERVQKEARRLRSQARRLRRAQSAETRQRKKLLEQISEASKNWGQNVLQRGNDLATSGMARTSDQMRSGQQKLREYGGGLMQSMGQVSTQATQNLSGLSGNTGERLRMQGKQLGQSASGWSDEAAYRMRKQGRQLIQNTSDLGDDLAYGLYKQKQGLLHNVADWGDEAAYQLRRRGRRLGHNLSERKEDATRQLQLQKRELGRNVAERREDMMHQLRRRGRHLGRNLSGRRSDMARQLRQQRGYLSERGGQMLEAGRRSRFWSIIGFLAGLLLAGGMTYWLVRGLMRRVALEEEDVALEVNEPVNNVGYREGGEMRSTAQGGTVVAARPATSAGPATRFVGVLSSRRFYPLGLNPDAPDLVYFDSEEDALAEGFKRG